MRTWGSWRAFGQPKPRKTLSFFVFNSGAVGLVGSWAADGFVGLLLLGCWAAGLLDVLGLLACPAAQFRSEGEARHVSHHPPHPLERKRRRSSQMNQWMLELFSFSRFRATSTREGCVTGDWHDSPEESPYVSLHWPWSGHGVTGLIYFCLVSRRSASYFCLVSLCDLY